MSAAVPIVSWTFVRSILVVTIAYRRDGSTSIETPQRNQRSHRADRGCRRAAPMERSVKTQKCGGGAMKWGASWPTHGSAWPFCCHLLTSNADA